MFNSLKLVAIAGAVSGIIGVACLIYIAWENAGSRNIAIGTGTLVGAVVLLGIQLLWELRSTTTTDFLTAEYTINRETPEIRAPLYLPDECAGAYLGNRSQRSGEIRAATGIFGRSAETDQ